ncbi:uncharacterized protein LOC110118668 [Ceratitis capitata]|uniref:uncharacterized protein LOC110118668 n=1 Tax=Ceratitis capitata TaxID=7213 RepID=UPI000A113611|nr:uncharacterized protein LOC110118668 [Ceratitis capitata]
MQLIPAVTSNNHSSQANSQSNNNSTNTKQQPKKRATNQLTTTNGGSQQSATKTTTPPTTVNNKSNRHATLKLQSVRSKAKATHDKHEQMHYSKNSRSLSFNSLTQIHAIIRFIIVNDFSTLRFFHLAAASAATWR